MTIDSKDRIKLRGVYIKTAIWVSLVIILNFIIIQWLLRGNDESAGIVNVAGRQRMLSILVVTNYRSAIDNEISVDSLRQTVDIWDSAHAKIKQDLRIVFLFNNDKKAIETKLNSLSMNIDLIKEIVKKDTLNPLFLDQISKNQYDFLIGMDWVVSQLQKNSERNSKVIGWIETALTFLLIGIIYYETRHVVMPALKARRLKEEELAGSKRILDAIYNSTSESISFMDTRHRLLYVNRRTEELVKKLNGHEVTIGGQAIDHLPKSVREYFSDVFSKGLKGEKFDAQLEMKGVWWDFSIFPVLEGDKQIGLAMITRNITKSKVAENRIIDQNKRLREIAWVQSHDVRRPLSNILGLLQLLDSGEATITEIEKSEILTKIKKESIRLDSIISDIASRSRIEDHET